MVKGEVVKEPDDPYVPPKWPEVIGPVRHRFCIRCLKSFPLDGVCPKCQVSTTAVEMEGDRVTEWPSDIPKTAQWDWRCPKCDAKQHWAWDSCLACSAKRPPETYPIPPGDMTGDTETAPRRRPQWATDAAEEINRINWSHHDAPGKCAIVEIIRRHAGEA